MKAILGRAIDRTIKQRVTASYPVYVFAKRIVSAFENHDVVMQTNGEHWLLSRIALGGPVTALDVGANQGEWVAGLLSVTPNARVICYEPVPSTFKSLRSKICAPNVLLVNMGLSSGSGELTINSVIDNCYISSVHDVEFYQEGHQIEAVSVQASTGDAEMATHRLSHIHIVKVDAEGHDLDVIKGFQHAINSETVDMFQFEYNQFTLAARRALRDFYSLFGSRYLLCRLLPRGLEACGYHPVLDNFGQSNWVAVRRGMIDEAVIRRFAIRPAEGVPGATLAKSLKDDLKLAEILGVAVP
ncbi:MAG: FkbM family methyltransferase [Cyanobacteria bacterium P01_F01_bin.33]